MPIPRHLKHPLALWIIDSRKAEEPPMKPADVARAIGVTEPTVRAWETVRANESKRLPSPDNVDAMAKLFGHPPPGRQPAPATGDLADAIRAQAAAINVLVEELRVARLEQAAWNRGVERVLRLAGEATTSRWLEEPTAPPGPQPREGAVR